MQSALKHQTRSLGGQAQRPARLQRLRTPAVTTTTEAPTAAAAAAEPASSTASNAAGVADIYIGKGRYVKDDPKKYPGKDDLGPLMGATGGWAGGEAALLQLREQLAREKAAQKAGGAGAGASSSAPAAAGARAPPAPKDGLQPIYVGYSKDELAARKAGVPGRFVLDDPRKYPAKEDLGIFSGATGGFAGGEAGLDQYVSTGQVRLRDPNQPGGATQSSPVAVAGLLVLAGGGGTLLLNELTDLGTNAVKSEILDAPIDEKTKGLLLVAVGLLAAVGALATGKALVSSLQDRISAASGAAQKLVVVGGFWLLVFVAARAVLEL